MAGLVVKEKIGLKLTQKFAFGQAAQKHGLVHLNVPVHERAYGALVRGGTACGNQRGANAHSGGAFLLQAVQGGQQGLKRSGRQGLQRLVAFVLLEGA